MARPQPTHGEPVTVTIAREVAPGRDGDFEKWNERLRRTSATYPGYLGSGLLRPNHVGEPWHVVFRFDSAENLAAWEASPARAELLAEGEELMKTTGVQRVSGLETWFELPGRTGPAPPRWKMFLVSVFCIYTLQVLLNLVLAPIIGGWVLPLRVLVIAGGVTALMTWLVMPRLARLLQSWLYAAPRRRAG